METLQTLVGFAEKARANTAAAGASAHHANFTSVDNYDDDVDEPGDAYQAHNDPVDPGSDDGDEALDDDDDEENDAFSSYVALDDVTVCEAAELDAIALLADTRDNDLDPEVSARVVQANAQAYLSVEKIDRKRLRQRQDQVQISHSSVTLYHWKIVEGD